VILLFSNKSSTAFSKSSRVLIIPHYPYVAKVLIISAISSGPLSFFTNLDMRPDFVIEMLDNFFGGNTSATGKYIN
jgi:hypothetical protein